MATLKSGRVYYGARPVVGGFGIHVIAWDHNNDFLEEDLNTTPWPTPALALDRAKRAAEAMAERLGLIVSGQIAADARIIRHPVSYWRGQ